MKSSMAPVEVVAVGQAVVHADETKDRRARRARSGAAASQSASAAASSPSSLWIFTRTMKPTGFVGFDLDRPLDRFHRLVVVLQLLVEVGDYAACPDLRLDTGTNPRPGRAARRWSHEPRLSVRGSDRTAGVEGRPLRRSSGFSSMDFRASAMASSKRPMPLSLSALSRYKKACAGSSSMARVRSESASSFFPIAHKIQDLLRT